MRVANRQPLQGENLNPEEGSVWWRLSDQESENQTMAPKQTAVGGVDFKLYEQPPSERPDQPSGPATSRPIQATTSAVTTWRPWITTGKAFTIPPTPATRCDGSTETTSARCESELEFVRLP
jgi:hypothetical protein